MNNIYDKYKNISFELDVEQLAELFEVCGITSLKKLCKSSKISYHCSANIFAAVKEGRSIRVTGGTLDKLCDLLTAYPEELLKDKDRWNDVQLRTI